MDTSNYFGSSLTSKFMNRRKSLRNVSPFEENSLRIREIAQQNVYIMFPHARDPMSGISSQANKTQLRIGSKSTTQLPKLQSGQDFLSKTVSTKASLTSKTFNKTMLEIGDKNDTIVKPITTTKRSEVNQTQGMFRDDKFLKKKYYEGLDNQLEYEFPFHQIVDFVKNHSLGFEEKHNTDFHKHYQRMYTNNKFQIKKLRNEKRERIIKIKEKIKKESEELEERRLQIKELYIEHRDQSKDRSLDQKEKMPLQVKHFIIKQNLKDLSEFNDLLNKYENYFQSQVKSDNQKSSQITKEDFARLNELYNGPSKNKNDLPSFQPIEGGLLWEILQKQNQEFKLKVINTLNENMKERDIFENQKKSIKIIEDIFIEQIIHFIQKYGVKAMAPVDYFNFKGIVMHRKRKFKLMKEELDDIIEIKRHIKYNIEGTKKKKQLEDEEEYAKFYITEEQASTVRRSQQETNDQTYQDSILNYKNSLSTTLGTERVAIHPKILEFIPPNSFLPKLQDKENSGKRLPFTNDFYNSFKNNTSLDNNNLMDNDKYGMNNDQSSMLQLSTHRIEDNGSIKKIIDEGMATDRNKSVQNLTERSKESQDVDDADINQLQYLMELNNQNENNEKDQEEAMRMKLQIIKLMMKDDKKSLMKKLTERILNRIEQRKESLLKQIEKEENQEKLEELQQELQREIKKKNVQLLLLTHTNSLKRVSHRLMYEYDQQTQYYRELSNSASLAGSDYLNSPVAEGNGDYDISPLAFETIYKMVDDQDDIIANFVINQLDKQGTLEKLLNHLKQQEIQTGRIDMDKVKEYIMMINNSIPQDEIKNLEMKNGKIVGRIKKNESKTQIQNLDLTQVQKDEVIEDKEANINAVEAVDKNEKIDQNHPDYYKFYQKNKPEKIQIRLKDRTSDESRKNRLQSKQSNLSGSYRVNEESDGDEDEENERDGSEGRIRKKKTTVSSNASKKKQTTKINVFSDLNNSKLKDLARVGSGQSDQSNNSSSGGIRTKQTSQFSKDHHTTDNMGRKEVLLQLKGYDQAQDVLLGDFTAEEQLLAQEQLRLRREEDQRKIKALGKKMKFTGDDDDPEMQRLQELIDFSDLSKKNFSLKARFATKKTKKDTKYNRSSSLEKTQKESSHGPQLKKTNSMDLSKTVSKAKDSTGKTIYVDKQGNQVAYYKGLSILAIDPDSPSKRKQLMYEEIEVEVTDSSDGEPEYDENGKLKPKQKKKKKKILLVQKTEDGQIILDKNQQLPKGIKITSDGRIVKITKHVLEDGTTLEIETEVQKNSVRKLTRDEQGNMVEEKTAEGKPKKYKKVQKVLPNGKTVEVEETDEELNISVSTDKMSISLIEEDPDKPLTPKTKQKLILEKKKEKKKKLLQQHGFDNVLLKKKIIKRRIKSNGEVEEIITEVDDIDGGVEILEYDKNGNLLNQTYNPPSNKEDIKREQKKKITQQIQKINLSNASLLSANVTGGGGTTSKRSQGKKKQTEETEWFNEDGTPWTSTKNRKNTNLSNKNANDNDGFSTTTNRNRKTSNISNMSKNSQKEKEPKVDLTPKPPQKIKQMIEGREVEYLPLASNESFHSDDIPSSLLDDSQSIKSGDLSQMSNDKKKMYQKIKKKREQAKQKKIREQLEKDIKDFRKNNVFTELEELMKQNLSLRELKRQIEVYIDMIKGKNIDDETKYNIFLYLQRKEQLVSFLIAFEDNFESHVLVRPEVMQEIRQFLKKRFTLVKAENEKRMKFSRPIVMPDGNGLSLFEEFKGDAISEWEIRQIMKYASYNQDVQRILERLRQFKEDSNAIIQLKLMLKRFECQVIQTDLDYLRANQDDRLEQDQNNLNSFARSKRTSLAYKDDFVDQIENKYNSKIQALRKYKQKNPEKFQGLVEQFQTVKHDSNIFKALKNDLAEKADKANMQTAKVTQAMWANRMKNFSNTKINFNSIKTSKIPYI